MVGGRASTWRWAVIDGGGGRSLLPYRQHPWRRPGWPGSHSQWERKLAWENQEELPLTTRSYGREGMNRTGETRRMREVREEVDGMEKKKRKREVSFLNRVLTESAVVTLES